MKVFLGVVKGVGQIYFQADVAAGILILFGMALCSPIAAVACLLGSFCSSMVALALGVPAQPIYDGIWVRKV